MFEEVATQAGKQALTNIGLEEGIFIQNNLARIENLRNYAKKRQSILERQEKPEREGIGKNIEGIQIWLGMCKMKLTRLTDVRTNLNFSQTKINLVVCLI